MDDSYQMDMWEQFEKQTEMEKHMVFYMDQAIRILNHSLLNLYNLYQYY